LATHKAERKRLMVGSRRTHAENILVGIGRRELVARREYSHRLTRDRSHTENIEKAVRKKVQFGLVHIAVAHLNRIVPQYRRLCAKQSKCIELNTGWARVV
jgi:hypothetical protein